MPENTVSVTRPGGWSNPFIPGKTTVFKNDTTGELILFCPQNDTEAVDFFRFFITSKPDRVEQIKKELHGKNLACWCSLYKKDGSRKPCHADVLLELANVKTEAVCNSK
jgi:hypothetical protein